MIKKVPVYKNFTKSDLVYVLSRKHQTTKVLSSLVVNTVLGSIARSLQKGNRVEIRGFGTFEMRKYEAYRGRNPQSGQEIPVVAKKVPFFKAGKLKERLRYKTDILKNVKK